MKVAPKICLCAIQDGISESLISLQVSFHVIPENWMRLSFGKQELLIICGMCCNEARITACVVQHLFEVCLCHQVSANPF